MTISGHKNDPDKAVSENIKQLTAEKRQFNRTRSAFLSDRQCKTRRIEFIHARSKYKHTKYYLQNLNKENRIAKLAEMESKDAKMFWRTVKHMINKRAAVANISPQNWVHYFRELLNMVQS